MVKNDATFLVLSGGNFDVIVARNRTEQTMYLSGPIDTTAQSRTGSEPGYIQIQVGLFLASIRDAINRAARLKACDRINSLPPSWTAYEKHHLIKKPKPLDAGVSLETVLFHCHMLCLVPATENHQPLYKSRNLYERYPREQGHHYNLRIWTQPTEDFNVCIGNVEVPVAEKVFEDYIIVKIAYGRMATNQLLEEFSVYCSLNSNPEMPQCKIPTIYGFFVDLSNENDPSAVLLLQNVGAQPPNELSDNQLYVLYSLWLDDVHALL